MSYNDFFQVFSAEVAAVGLGDEFSPAWLSKLQRTLSKKKRVLNAPEFAFFVTAFQVYAECLNDRDAIHCFMEEVAKEVAWIKTKPRGRALVRRLSQASPDGPISALFEIFSAWKLDASSSASLVEIDFELPDSKKLDAKIDVKGQPLLVECYASMTTSLATSGTFDGYWSPDTDPAIPKIRKKILNKADQASSSLMSVAMLFAPSADFLMPPEKIPHAVNSAFAVPKSKSLSAVVFTGGSHPYLCEPGGCLFENPGATYPLDQNARSLLQSLLA